MAANNDREAELAALLLQVDQLNADNAALQQQAAADALQIQNQANAIAAANQAAVVPPVGQPNQAGIALQVGQPALQPVPPTVKYASCPGRHDSDSTLDFSKKPDLSLFKSGCKSLYEGDRHFDGTTSNLTMFLKLLTDRSNELAWSEASNPQQINWFTTTPSGSTTNVQINVVNQYAMIGVADLTQQCARFMTGADKESRANQNNSMMAKCIHHSLTTECQLQLIQYETEYTVAGSVCAPLLLKVLMRIVTMDSVATSKSLRAELFALDAYASQVKGDVKLILAKFVEINNRLRAAGEEVKSTVDYLFQALKAVHVPAFVQYIVLKEDAHDDGTVPVSPEQLIIWAQQKYNLMVDKGEWTVETSKKDEIVAMRAEIDDLKGKLTLTDKTKVAIEGGPKTTGKNFQKTDEAWKKTPPAAGEPRTKKIRNKTFHWCEHHMAWTMHKPDDCRLRPGYSDPATNVATPLASSATDSATPASVTPQAMTAEAILGRLESAIGAANRY
jgi:hypothetical protein